VDDDGAFFLRLAYPLHAHDVIFGGVAALNQENL
jgi:hypothetical protein